MYYFGLLKMKGNAVIWRKRYKFSRKLSKIIKSIYQRKILWLLLHFHLELGQSRRLSPQKQRPGDLFSCNASIFKYKYHVPKLWWFQIKKTIEIWCNYRSVCVYNKQGRAFVVTMKVWARKNHGNESGKISNETTTFFKNVFAYVRKMFWRISRLWKNFIN